MATDEKYGPEKVKNYNLTIASSGTTSGALRLGGGCLMGVLIPATFTGTTISIHGSVDNTNFYAIDNLSSLAVSTSTWVNFAPQDTAGYPYIKVVSGSAEGAERTLTCTYGLYL